MNRWKNSVKALAFSAVLAVMAGGAVLTAFAEDNTRFVTGTEVNGIGISGMTVEEAAAQIESFYNAGYTLTLTGRDGKTEKIKGSQIEVEAKRS